MFHLKTTVPYEKNRRNGQKKVIFRLLFFYLATPKSVKIREEKWTNNICYQQRLRHDFCDTMDESNEWLTNEWQRMN